MEQKSKQYNVSTPARPNTQCHNCHGTRHFSRDYPKPRRLLKNSLYDIEEHMIGKCPQTESNGQQGLQALTIAQTGSVNAFLKLATINGNQVQV